MKIAVIGCGYVFDHYMDTLHRHPNLTLVGVADRDPVRQKAVREYFGVKVYESTEAVMADPEVELIVNLTDPHNHYPVNKQALLAGKHVYCEKPLAMAFGEARELVELAASRGLLLSGAPCSVLSETAQTMWKAVRDGAIGRPLIAYAELDDNPIYLMKPEGWRNSSGAPWPYRGEYEVGCTLEHAGYYLTWLCAVLGPAVSVTSFSAPTVVDKTPLPLNPPDTPDFSVGCIQFASGAVARLTCSIVGPYDHRLRFIGNEGTVTTEECWHYRAPVRIERFSQLSLNARKARSVRESNLLKRVFGADGQTVPLAIPGPSLWRRYRDELKKGQKGWLGSALKMLKKRELVSMDFFRGPAEMARALEEQRRCRIPPDFLLHVVELTLAIQNARSTGAPYSVTTRFEPLEPTPETLASAHHYGQGRTTWLQRISEGLIARLHRQ
jgi:predicted dehydrogenase